MSIRTRFLLVVLGGAVLPLALIGAWLARSSERAGEALLLSQLRESLEAQAAQLEATWRYLEADLLLLADNDVAWRTLSEPPGDAEPPPFILTTFRHSSPRIRSVRYSDVGGRSRISLSEADREIAPALDAGPGGAPGAGRGLPGPGRQPTDSNGTGTPVPFLEVALPVHDGGWNEIGQLTAGLDIRGLIQAEPSPRAVNALFAIADARDGRPLLGEEFPAHPGGARFRREGEDWIGAALAANRIPLELRMAAPLAPVVGPFARNARNGAVALFLVAATVVLVTTFLTTRMTRPILAATRAAEAIAAGDMDHRVPAGGTDEIGRLGRAFNTMAASLRDTLDALSVQRSHAALGEFATSLAHEVRNAHTSIGLDIQRVIRSLDDRPAERAVLERSLTRVRSVDRVVDGALGVARSGRVVLDDVDLVEVIRAAEHAARPWFDERGAFLLLTAVPSHAVWIRGDAAALETMFLNLLRNAAQALGSGGRAELAIEVDGSFARVDLRDDGVGMTADQLQSAFDLFVTGRAGGTGLGLSIARQIAIAHGSDIHLDSAPGTGTRCWLRFATRTA